MLSPIKSSPSLDNYASSPRSPYQLQHFSDVEESSNESNNVATDAMKDLEIIQTAGTSSRPIHAWGFANNLQAMVNLHFDSIECCKCMAVFEVVCKRFVTVYRKRSKLILVRNISTIGKTKFHNNGSCPTQKNTIEVLFPATSEKVHSAFNVPVEAERRKRAETKSYVVDKKMAGRGAGFHNRETVALALVMLTKFFLKGPSLCSWITLRKQLFTEDEPILRFKPYFGDNDQEDVVSSNFELKTKQEWLKDRTTELAEEVDYFIIKDISFFLKNLRNETETKGLTIKDSWLTKDLLTLAKESLLLSRKVISVNFRGLDSSEETNSCTPESKEVHEATCESIFDSYNVLFCRCCKIYDCKVHKHSYESLPYWQKLALNQEKQSLLMYTVCNNTGVTGIFPSNILIDEIWTRRYKVIVEKILTTCLGNIEKTVALLGKTKWDCKTLMAKCQKSGILNFVRNTAYFHRNSRQRKKLKRKSRRRKISNTLYCEMKKNNKDIASRFLPCAHDHICCKNSCWCSKRGHFCLKQCTYSIVTFSFYLASF